MLSREFKCRANGTRVLVVGDHTSVRIERMTDTGVKLLIEAPRDIQIDRGSIFDRKNIEDPERSLKPVSSFGEDNGCDFSSLPLFLHEGEVLHIGPDVRLTLNTLLKKGRRADMTIEAPEDLSPAMM